MPQRRTSKLRPDARRHLRCEPLEDRRMLAVFTVDSMYEDGPGSLTEKLLQAASNPGPDQVVFASELSGAIIELHGEYGNFDIRDEDGVTIDGSLLSDRLTLRPQSSWSDETKENALTIRAFGDVALVGINIEAPLLNRGQLKLVETTISHTEYRRGPHPILVSRVIENASGATLSLIRSAIFDNLVRSKVLVNRGTASIIDSTISHNSIGEEVWSEELDVIYNDDGELLISRSTIVAGPEFYGSRGFVLDLSSTRDESIQINSSIIDGPVLTRAGARVGFGLPEGNGNLFSDVSAQIEGEENLFGLNPRLGPIADNGGPTPTRALLPGSPAIDAGPTVGIDELPAHDARGDGYDRVTDGGLGAARIDIGAYEAQAEPRRTPGDFNDDGYIDAADYSFLRDSLGSQVAPLTGSDATGDGIVDEADRRAWKTHYGFHPIESSIVVNSLSDLDDGVINNGSTTLREAIRFANETLWADTIVFDPSLNGATIDIARSQFDHYYPGRNYYLLRDALTIDASGLPDKIILDGGEEKYGFFNASLYLHRQGTSQDFDITLKNLIIRNGWSVVESQSTGAVTLEGVTVEDIEYDTERLFLVDSSGAIRADGPVTLVDSIVERATTDDSAFISAVHSQTSVSLVRSEMRDSTGGVSAGTVERLRDVFVSPTLPIVHLIDSTISGAQTQFGVVAHGDVHLTNSHIRGGAGGGVLAYDATRAVQSTESPYDTEFVYGGHVTLIDSSVTDNELSGSRGPLSPFIDYDLAGGGIAANRNVSLVRSRVENNTATIDRRGGGGIATAGRVQLLDSTVAGNTATRGGGVYARDSFYYDHPDGTPAVSVIGSTIANNTSTDGSGSAIYSTASILVDQSSVYGNLITDVQNNGDHTNAAIYLADHDRAARIDILDSVITANRAEARYNSTVTPAGHAVAATQGYGAEVHVERSHITDNFGDGVAATSVVDSFISRNEGTGVVAATDRLTINGSTVSGNQIGVGGSTNWDGVVHLEDTVVRGNRIGVTGRRVSLDRSLIAENVLPLSDNGNHSGAGISATSVTANDSMIRDNVGGGILAESVTLHRTTISGNTTTGLNAHGAGIYASGRWPNLDTGGSVRLIQSTVSNNRTLGPESHGGGIYAGELTSQSSTIAENSTADATSEGGGVYIVSSPFFKDTLIANNSAVVGPDVRNDGVANQVVRSSLIGDTSGFVIHDATDSLLDVDPLLGPLADNGGPTLTHALLPGSPAINAGDPTAEAVPWDVLFWGIALLPYDGLTDQRGDGFPRVTDGGVTGVYRIDIGAVEFPGVAAPVAPPAPIAVLTSPPAPTAIGSQSTSATTNAIDSAATDEALLLLVAEPTLEEAEADIETAPGNGADERGPLDDAELGEALAVRL